MKRESKLMKFSVIMDPFIVPLQLEDSIQCLAPSNKMTKQHDDHVSIEMDELVEQQDHFKLSDRNLSVLEQELPSEIIIYILQFLTAHDLGILNRTSRNFRYYWIGSRSGFNWKFLHEFKNHSDYHLFIGPDTDSELSSYLFKKYWCRRFEQSFKKLEYGRESFNSDFASIALLGPPHSGKTSYCRSFMRSEWPLNDNNYQPTVKFQTCCVSFRRSSGSTTVLKLCDVGFTDRTMFQQMLFMNFVMFFFDLSDEQSFEECVKYIKHFVQVLRKQPQQLNSHLLSHHKTVCIVGAKSDLPRKVPDESIQKLLNTILPNEGVLLGDLRIQYFELSSKENKGTCYPLYFIMRTHLKSREATGV
ncbi:hypothetical protein C9374_012457 [Naegleria lovaniensis]|uniref:F-box domain-containing protein n=1 Tax=Naegleria lovaniensis TaxID=51637 RepID=A0AA88GZS0_NAELO|nr:uncharacterized protein C9374_012457 [Naegleria lovaniensis]KAG2392205.1 hypothetical protein C9374_012457 [Naegleria lovaniensis]